jgi:hypothetical protein
MRGDEHPLAAEGIEAAMRELEVGQSLNPLFSISAQL